MSEPKAVLITGASSGIGRATARLLAQRGFTVFGTSRNPASAEKLSDVEMLPLDVRSDEAVTACVEAVLSQAGRVDILINNAGYVLGGAVEETTLAEAKAVFETNFWGTVRMVTAVLPVMRRQGGGQIINISSLSGLVGGPPFHGFYCASKFALEGYSEVLRHEVKPFNVQVSLVEPGAFKSNLGRNRQYATNQLSDYSPWRQRVEEIIRGFQENVPEAIVVAECILGIIQNESPRLRYRVGREAALLFQLRRFLPEPLFEQVMRRNFHQDAKK